MTDLDSKELKQTLIGFAFVILGLCVIGYLAGLNAIGVLLAVAIGVVGGGFLMIVIVTIFAMIGE